jgi:flagellar assembly protein FliH
MAVIRQSQADRIVKDAIVLDLGDLTRQGEQVRSRAKADAEAILAKAAQERQKLIISGKEEGAAKGHAEGLAKGLEEGKKQGYEAALAERRQQLDALAAGWTAALDGFEQERDRMLLEARHDILRLAVMMGERVTRRKIEVDALVVQEQLESVLSLLAQPTRLSINVNPEDEGLARESLPALMGRFSAAQHVDVRADASLTRGSCIATTAGGGILDASIPTQLDRMVQALMPGPGPAATGTSGATP